MGQVFEVKTGRLAIGDPTMGFAHYTLSGPAALYRLGKHALLPVEDESTVKPELLINLDSPCLFALDEAHLAAFEEWYHQVGGACSYNVLEIASRLPEFEASAGSRVGFYWEYEVANPSIARLYTLDMTTAKRSV